MKINVFADKTVREGRISELADLLQARESVIWVDMTGPSEEDLRVMHDVFKFHPLAIEDTQNHHQRPKAEEYSDHVFIILNPVTDDGLNCSFRELDIFIGWNYIVTVHAASESTVDQAFKRINPLHMPVSVTATYLLYVLMDVIVDEYFPVLDRIEEELGKLNNELLTKPSKDILNRLFQLKNTLSLFWRVLWPQRDVLNVLMNHNLAFIDKNTRYYLRDVADHLQRIGDEVHFFNEMVAGMVNLYTSAFSNQLNQVVNRLTVFTITIGALSVIVGFYGMNFLQTWPPFDAPWGILFAIGLMIAVVVVSLVVFRRRD